MVSGAGDRSARSRVVTSAAAAAFGVALLAPRAARAQNDPEADGVYGRLDGDLLIVGEAGASVSVDGTSMVVGGRALYLSTAGVFTRYLEGFGNDDLPASRILSAGVELRPLFLARFARDLERGPAHLDLLLDSLAIDVGAFWWAPPGGSLVRLPGLEVGLGLDVPILPRASGPHLGAMAAMRVSHHGVGAAVGEDLDLAASSLLLTFSWHAVIDAGIVDAGDALAR
jgi:hypothetical protein